MNKHLLNRRQFSARCAAFGISFHPLSATIAMQAGEQVPGTAAPSKSPLIWSGFTIGGSLR